MTGELVAERITRDRRSSKTLWRYHDGGEAETVVMHLDRRMTVCVSSQVGCAMGCVFCATGQSGYGRNLTVDEIVQQVVTAQRRSASDIRTNVVFMGMGEPLANYDAVLETVRVLNDDFGIPRRHVTISTVGIVPGIRRLADDDRTVRLAVSLHAANDRLRSSLVPINRVYPLADIVAACRHYAIRTRRRVSLEWTLIAGVNDSDTDAAELTEVALTLGAHVNVIPLNPTANFDGKPPPVAHSRKFCAALRAAGVACTLRRNRGAEVEAACGQLRAAGLRNGRRELPPLPSA
jgi:23S rRNA (adenine2503-C2)-methyltransferase